MKSALLLMGLQFLSFLVVTLNYRYCAKGRIRATVTTDALVAALSFTLFKLIQDASTSLEMAGYTCGACLGSAAGMYLTRGLDRV